MTRLCSMADVEILRKIHSGEWLPSLDTGQVYSTMKKGFLNHRSNNGYHMVGSKRVSHIIWVAANGPIPYGMQIDHINGDKTDNRICNLQLVSASKNRHLSNAVLTYSQAEEIRRRYADENISKSKLGRDFGVSETTIHKIVTNRSYTNPVETDHISKETRRELLEAYKNGRSIDTIRSSFKIQQAVVRQVLEEELDREAKERNKQETQS